MRSTWTCLRPLGVNAVSRTQPNPKSVGAELRSGALHQRRAAPVDVGQSCCHVAVDDRPALVSCRGRRVIDFEVVTQPAENARKQPGDLHLTHPEVTTDLHLGETVDEA
jgi:hypothetical protein